MKKIVLLGGKEITDTLFTEANYDELRKMGDFVINQKKEDPDYELIKDLIRDANIAITTWGCPQMDKDILDAAPNLEAIVHAAGSIKGVVPPEAWQRGIRVTNSTEPLGKGVAEVALGMTLVSLKNMWRLSQDTKKGEWTKDKKAMGKKYIKDVFQITIGVIGAGRAGRHYIRLLKNFDVDILLYDPFITEEQAILLGVKKSNLDELLSISDVVSIHAPNLKTTQNMLNKERLQLMKDDAIIINTARGALIDEEALVEELSKGRLFACLDVTNPEPPAEDHPFRTLDNVILTPHLAGLTNNGRHRLGAHVVKEVELFLNGQKMGGEIEYDQLSILA